MHFYKQLERNSSVYLNYFAPAIYKIQISASGDSFFHFRMDFPCVSIFSFFIYENLIYLKLCTAVHDCETRRK